MVSTVPSRQEPIAAPASRQRSPRIERIEVALATAAAYDAADAPSPHALRGRRMDVLCEAKPGRRLATPALLPVPQTSMKPQRFDVQFAAIVDLAAKLCAKTDAASLLVMLEGPTEWDKLRGRTGELQVV